jgi:hypothetical protein
MYFVFHNIKHYIYKSKYNSKEKKEKEKKVKKKKKEKKKPPQEKQTISHKRIYLNQALMYRKFAVCISHWQWRVILIDS